MADVRDEPGRTFRLAPKTIRSLAIFVAALSALVTAILGGLTYWVVHEEIERQIDHRIEIETRGLIQYELDHGFQALLDAIRIREATSVPPSIGYLDPEDDGAERTMGYIVADAAGKRRGGTLDAQMPPIGWSEFVRFERPDGTTGIAQAMRSRLSNGGNLVVAADRAMVDRIDKVLLKLFMGAFGTLLLAGVGITLAFGHVIRSRLRAMEMRASAIMSGDMTQRMPMDSSGGELNRLSKILNEMLDRISILISNLREVSSGLAHDLRTPLSRMRAKLEQAERLTTEPAQQQLLVAATDDSDQLLNLFESILAIAEIDGGSMRRRFEPVELGEAIADIAEAYRPSIEDSGRTFELTAAPARILGDRALLQRLVGNLLDNSLVHTPPGTAISVDVGPTDDGYALLRVADDGPGVAEHDRERMFERHVRLDASRSGAGYGLGLSIVRSIAIAHGGQIHVVPAMRGLTVECRIALS